MISELQRQFYEIESSGMRIHAAEVGPKTWESLIDDFECGRRRKIPPKDRKQLAGLHFMGVPIRPNEDVPEGKLWPLEEHN